MSSRVNPKQRAAIDWELETYFHAIGTIYVTSVIYHLALTDLPESEAWKKGREMGQPEGRAPEGSKCTESHWSNCIGLMDMNIILEDELAGYSHSLYDMTLVSLWGTTEAKLDDIMLKFVAAAPKVLRGSEFAKLTAPVVDILKMSNIQRYRLLLNLFKEKVGAPMKKGIGRFEAVFGAIGLGGGVPEGVRRRFMEMSEIRHNLVHRMGIVDKKLVEACPWMDLSENRRIWLTNPYIEECLMCIKVYIMEIDFRIRRFFGEPIPERAQALSDFYLSHFDETIGPRACPSSNPNDCIH
jgi:hypothetical protein